MKQHNFGDMRAPTRSVAIELAEHADEIAEWRNGLSERQRGRVIHPLSVTRRWRAATQANGKSATDLRRDALAGWRRFVSCVGMLPPDQSRLLWAAVAGEVAAAALMTSN